MMDSDDDIEENPLPSSSKSTRTRKAKEKPAPTVYQSTPYNPLDWTEDEKKKLAIALQKYGHLDIDKLHEEVKTRSPAQIKHYVYWTIKKSRIYIEKEEEGPATSASPRIFSKSPIDQWLSALEEGKSRLLDDSREWFARSLLYISRFEPHPDPTECGGVDYAAMYEFLYLAICGYPVKAVNPPTAAVLLEELDKLASKISGPGNEKVKEHLSKVKRLVFVENATKRHYGRKDKDNKSSRPIECLLDIKGFNPLGIPYDLLTPRPSSNS